MEYLPFKKWETSVKQNNKVPAGKWHITITENDQRFYNAMRDCGAEGVFQFSTKYEARPSKRFASLTLPRRLMKSLILSQKLPRKPDAKLICLRT